MERLLRKRKERRNKKKKKEERRKKKKEEDKTKATHLEDNCVSIFKSFFGLTLFCLWRIGAHRNEIVCSTGKIFHSY